MLEVSDLTKLYTLTNKVVPVLKRVSFSIAPKDFIFLTGPSGSGKTTLIKLLILQEKPTLGKINFEKIPVTEIPNNLIPEYRRMLGVVFQDYKLLEHKTVLENILFVLEMLRNNDDLENIAMELLDIVGLADKAKLFPKQLSGGEKRRVVIARSIANNPKLLIADEPTGDLDNENAHIIMALLQKINQSGTAILMTTHNRELIKTYNKFNHWELENGLLNGQKTSNIMNDYKDKLNERILDKLIPLAPEKREDLLALTPAFLKDVLLFSDEEVKTLVSVLKSEQTEK